jgi:hypothetical protein
MTITPAIPKVQRRRPGNPSATQGGPGAYLTQVSIDEQRAQGQLLSSFYRQNGVNYGDPYAIWIDWGK